MADYDYTFALNGKQLAARVHEHVEGEHTYYDILFEDRTLSIYKNTLYTWTSDDPLEFSTAALQSLGEQIDDPEP